MSASASASRLTGRALGGLAGLALLAGCASGGVPDPEADMRESTPVRVEVENHNTSNVVVYAVYGGQRHRMGEITALGDGVLRLPPSIPDGVRVRFQLDPIGPATRFLSQDFFIDRGDVVVIRVQPNIRQSTVSIR